MLIGVAVALLLLPAGGEEAEEPEEDASAIVGNRDHQEALKACTALAVQRHQILPSTRIQVTLTIEAGAVSAVAVKAPKGLSAVTACLEGRLKHWTFPATAEPYSIDVPVILQGSAR